MDSQHEVIEGVGASPGIAIGRAFIWKKTGYQRGGASRLGESDVGEQVGKFRSAVNQAIDDVESLMRASRGALTVTESDLLEMQLEMLADPQLHSDVVTQISEQRQPAAEAVWEVSDRIMRTLEQLDSSYLQARRDDVRACAEHIVRHIQGEQTGDVFRDMPAGSVLVADDISPLEALSLDLNQVAGIVTRFGGSTSHAAILARARSIPAVVACGENLTLIAHGDALVADGSSGQVWRNPTREVLLNFERKQVAFAGEESSLRSLSSQRAITVDGRAVRLMANISGHDEMRDVLQHGAEGAGLFRTEMLFMNRSSFPTEEEQFDCYKQVLHHSNGAPVTLRTLDIGGDKPLAYFNLPREENPVLGFRAIRISLDRVELFQEQLRAILRASAFGDLRVMFPMITTVNELRKAKEILEEAKDQLRRRGVTFNDNLPVGTMIETPAAAVMADMLAKEVDFFSIGTNDLTQYTLAVDRGNDKIKTLYDPFHPAVLRLIAHTTEQAVKHHIDISMCGEMAGDVMATPLLVGMGLQSLSMTAGNIPHVKRAILQGSHARAQQITAAVMQMDDAVQIREHLTQTVSNW